MFPKTEFLSPLELQKPSEETFFIGDEEFPRWILIGDEWIELDEGMVFSELCPECKQLGYCK